MNKTLNDIVKIKGRIGWRGYTVEDLRDSGPMVIGANDITTDNKLTLKNVKHISREKFEESPEIMIKKNDILVVKVGSTIGKVAIVDFDIGEACINPNTVLLKNCKEDPIYLYYYLKSNFGQKFLLNNSLASAQSALSQTTLKKLPIYFPEIKEQKKVVRIIRNIDKKIDINDKINSELEKIVKTLYDYWFVQFDFPDENGKPYKSSGGKMVWSEDLKREIPKEWRVKTLGDFCDIYQPQTISNNDCIENGGYFVHGSNGIIGKYDKYNHEESEIIVSCRGDCGNIHRTLPKTWITGNAMVFKIKDKTIHNEFLYQSLKYSGIKNVLSGSVQGQITRTNVSPLKIIFPEKINIDKFSDISKNIVTKKLLIQEENQKLAELRDWLLPMLMNGQVTIM